MRDNNPCWMNHPSIQIHAHKFVEKQKRRKEGKSWAHMSASWNQENNHKNQRIVQAGTRKTMMILGFGGSSSSKCYCWSIILLGLPILFYMLLLLSSTTVPSIHGLRERQTETQFKTNGPWTLEHGIYNQDEEKQGSHHDYPAPKKYEVDTQWTVEHGMYHESP
jgi:hypothetical protein